jgi:hypothetical protein
MKKIFFSIMAIAMLSTVAFAGGGKGDAKKHKAVKTCPTNCPPNCPPNCPHMPGGSCS